MLHNSPPRPVECRGVDMFSYEAKVAFSGFGGKATGVGVYRSIMGLYEAAVASVFITPTNPYDPMTQPILFQAEIGLSLERVGCILGRKPFSDGFYGHCITLLHQSNDMFSILVTGGSHRNVSPRGSCGRTGWRLVQCLHRQVMR
jgi:hypothetical protein